MLGLDLGKRQEICYGPQDTNMAFFCSLPDPVYLGMFSNNVLVNNQNTPGL